MVCKERVNVSGVKQDRSSSVKLYCTALFNGLMTFLNASLAMIGIVFMNSLAVLCGFICIHTDSYVYKDP